MADAIVSFLNSVSSLCVFSILSYWLWVRSTCRLSSTLWDGGGQWSVTEGSLDAVLAVEAPREEIQTPATM